MIEKEVFLEALRDKRATRDYFPVFSVRQLQRIASSVGVDLPNRAPFGDMINCLYNAARAKDNLDGLVEATINEVPQEARQDYQWLLCWKIAGKQGGTN